MVRIYWFTNPHPSPLDPRVQRLELRNIEGDAAAEGAYYLGVMAKPGCRFVIPLSNVATFLHPISWQR